MISVPNLTADLKTKAMLKMPNARRRKGLATFSFSGDGTYRSVGSIAAVPLNDIMHEKVNYSRTKTLRDERVSASETELGKVVDVN